MSKPTDPSPQLGSGTVALAVGALAVAAIASMFPWAAAGVALVVACLVALVRPRSQDPQLDLPPPESPNKHPQQHHAADHQQPKTDQQPKLAAAGAASHTAPPAAPAAALAPAPRSLPTPPGPTPAAVAVAAAATVAAAAAAGQGDGTEAAAAPAALTGSAAILAKLRAARGSSAAGKDTPGSGSSSSGATAAPVVTFAYASQTGTAQEIARSLAAEWASRGQRGQALSLNELGAGRINKDACPVLVVVAASTGDGDPPDNSAVAYVALKKAVAGGGGSAPAAGVHYALLGLGDSNYTRFMAVPRGIKNALTDLGATPFYPYLEADEVDGLEDKVDPWTEGLWGPLAALVASLTPGGSSSSGAGEAGSRPTTAPAAESSSSTAGLLDAITAASLDEPPAEAAAAAASAGGALLAMELSPAPSAPQEAVSSAAPSRPISAAAAAAGTAATVSSAAPSRPIPAAAAAAAAAGAASRPLSGASSTTSSAAGGGVPPLPPCRVMVNMAVPPEVAAAARSKAGQRPTPEQAAYVRSDGQYTAVDPFWAAITDAKLLTSPGSDRRVVHLELDLGGSGAGYGPGDSLGLLPANDPALVEGLLGRLGLEGETVFSVEPAAGDAPAAGLLPHLGCPTTLRAAFTTGLDLTSPPRKSLLRVLAEYCGAPADKEVLLRWCSKAGREDYAAEVTAGSPTLLDLLQRFPSCTPPLAPLLDALPALAPRMYSVTTSPVEYPTRPQVAFSTVTFATKYGTRRGVATHWLERLAAPLLGDSALTGLVSGDVGRVPVFVRPTHTFRPPQDLSVPLIMIGPGTGVAPFRGFLQQRRQQRAQQGADGCGAALLYFGCRRREEDYLYGADWEGFLEDGTLTRLRTAFSREQDAKVYVQHLLLEDGPQVAALIDAGARVYVCGDGAAMAKDVHSALTQLLATHSSSIDSGALGSSGAEAAAAAMLADMTKAGGYVRDIWS